MNTDRLICVLSLSKTDVFGRGINAVDWLRNKDEKPYYFRTRKPKNGLPSGSIVLFSFQGQIFGQATVKEDVRELSPQEQEQARKRDHFDYRYSMILNGSSIEIFRNHPTKKDVAPKIRKNFGRLFTYLNAVQYQQILKMAGE
jgi:hypothetical protein